MAGTSYGKSIAFLRNNSQKVLLSLNETGKVNAEIVNLKNTLQMKRIGFFLFFCILSLHGIAQVENDKDTLIIRTRLKSTSYNEMNEG